MQSKGWQKTKAKCGKRLTSKLALKYQLHTHTKQKRPISVVIWQVSQVSICSPRTHQGTYRNKTFRCELCHLAFARNGDLGKHINTHTPVKQHNCSIWIKPFLTSGDLNRHERFHPKLKLRTFDLCSNSFTAKSNLQRYIKSVHHNINEHELNLWANQFPSHLD